MELGAFSISLAVADIAASRDFYEQFGFEVVMRRPFRGLADTQERRPHGRPLPGDVREEHPHVQSRLGQPGASAGCAFTDVRELQRQLKARGVQLVNEADESGTGPASFVAIDPDGNPILVDQHV